MKTQTLVSALIVGVVQMAFLALKVSWPRQTASFYTTADAINGLVSVTIS